MYTLFSVPILVISYVLFKKSAGNLSIKDINLHSLIFYYQLILLCFIGVNIAALYLDEHYSLSNVTDPKIRLKSYIAVSYVMLMLPLTMYITNNIFKINVKREWNKYTNQAVNFFVSKKDEPVFLLIIVLLFLTFGALIYSISIIGTLPIWEAIKGKDSLYLAQLRIQASREFEGNSLIKNLLGLNLSQILSYIVYVYKLKYKRMKWNILFVFTVVLSVLTQTLSTEKAPIIFYLIGFLMINVLINGRITKKSFIGFFVVFVSITLFLYAILGFNIEFTFNDGPIGRMVLGQITPLFYYFLIFPDTYPFLGLISSTGESAARIVMSVFNPGGLEQGTAGVMNTLFIAEAYAHFSIYGIILSPIVVGLIIQVFYLVFLKMPKNPITIATYVFVALKLQASVTGGIWAFIYNPNIIFIVLVILMIVISVNILKKTVLIEGGKS